MSRELQAPVVAGVLSKYANIAKGWRPRLFILDDGRLCYFKVSGSARGHVHTILQDFSNSGREVRIIGAETALISVEGSRAPKHGSAEGPQPAGEYSLAGMKVRESRLESHKFYVNTGSTVLHLKCETPDDRAAWVSSLSAAKLQNANGGFPYADPGDSVSLTHVGEVSPATTTTTTNDLVQQLRSMGAPPAACSLVESSLRETLAQHKAEVAKLNAAVARYKRQAKELAEDKRVLETRFVSENHSSALQSIIDAGDRMPEGSEGEASHESSRSDKDDGTVPDFESDEDTEFDKYCDADGDEFFDAHEVEYERRRAAKQLPGRPSAAGSAATAAPPPLSADGSAVGRPAGDGAPSPFEPAWTKELGPSPPRRDRLPPPKEREKTVSLWSIIKECVGKDLTRVCLPVFFNEPLSALEKMAEEVEYSYLLDRAARCPRGSPQRMMYMGVFAVTGYAATTGRTCKPFNPLLGETFEFVDAQRGLRFLGEKVIHHPTVMAACCEGRGWTLECDMEGKNKFWGRLIELKPVGRLQITFHDGEVINWNKVTTTINNIVVGKVYIDHGGVMRVQSSLERHELRIKFKDGGLFTQGKHHVSGALCVGKDELPDYSLAGTWDGAIEFSIGGGQTQVWRATPPPPEPTRYNLTQFAIMLNEITPGLEQLLCPTDSRLRPDQSFLEQGRYTEANAEKQRLEVKQRAARKAADEGEPIKSRWFQPVPGARRGEQLAYKYAGGYWESRAAGQYKDCRDIFGA